MGFAPTPPPKDPFGTLHCDTDLHSSLTLGKWTDLWEPHFPNL